MITKYGYSTVGVISIISFILIASSFFISAMPVRVILIALAVLMMVFTLNFFRDPERTSPIDETAVLSPADGRVLFVKEVDDHKYVNRKAKQVSVFMSPLNVHVNRIPIDGTIEIAKHVEGEYLVAYDDKASEKNERSEIGISSKFGKVFFTQVAGFVARRIVFELNVGDSVTAGNRFGMIKFGSRVDVIVPHECEVLVKKDEIVRAGETILFKFPRKN
ncbi:MAG: phosphatidylserine decarboxylase family protein [Ignavibacteriaceae bacterium]|nr:phosphatidylserine decarboxylase family protein [Ignavibacteriaceae bacterium]